MKQLRSRLILKDVYPAICCCCDKNISVKPSIFMQITLNIGGGKCVHCGELLHLEIADCNEKMISQKLSDWREQEKKKEELKNKERWS